MTFDHLNKDLPTIANVLLGSSIAIYVASLFENEQHSIFASDLEHFLVLSTIGCLGFVSLVCTWWVYRVLREVIIPKNFLEMLTEFFYLFWPLFMPWILKMLWSTEWTFPFIDPKTLVIMSPIVLLFFPIIWCIRIYVGCTKKQRKIIRPSISNFRSLSTVIIIGSALIGLAIVHSDTVLSFIDQVIITAKNFIPLITKIVDEFVNSFYDIISELGQGLCL